jgi:predicted ester cyclase
MGKNLDAYNAYFAASWADPPASLFETNKNYLSEDFQTLDLDGSVQMNKEAYLGLTSLLFMSFPDFKSVIHEVREEGDSVMLRSHFEGTFTSDLDFSAMGMGVIPASGKKIVWPEATTKWDFDGDQIASIQAADDNGGIGPFLAALGITPTGA